MAKFTVLVPDRLDPPADIERDVFGPDVTIHTPAATDPTEIPDELWAEADVVLAWHDLEFTPSLLAKLTSCQILVRVGVGYDNVDLAAAANHGIPVCNVPDYGTNDVADHTMALLLSLWRGVPYYNERIQRSNDGWTWQTEMPMHRLSTARMAVIGLGRIGSAVALRAKAFGIDVVAYDPYVPDGHEKSLGIDRVRSLEAAITDANIVTFHTPLTEETRGMADDAFFERLDDDAIVVNTARGEIIEFDALHRALRDETIQAAGLDVLEREPPDPEHPLMTAWREDAEWVRGRLLLTPHAAFYCEEALHEMRQKAAETAYTYLVDGRLRNCVNEELL
jgi:D-3-phosphoglycerate dehydrogenase